MSTVIPSVTDMEVAALWLEANEGDAGESDSCKRVAIWLLKQAENKELRILARENGVRVTDLRKAISKAG